MEQNRALAAHQQQELDSKNMVKIKTGAQIGIEVQLYFFVNLGFSCEWMVPHFINSSETIWFIIFIQERSHMVNYFNSHLTSLFINLI